ncbi:MAG: hypothetical protein AB7T38_11570 [Nitrospirales bacterium]
MNMLSPVRLSLQTRSRLQGLPFLLVGLYVVLLVFAALCGSNSMMVDFHHQHPHHQTHHLILCSWACHVSQTSTELSHSQLTFALLLLTVSAFSTIYTYNRRFLILLPTSRGPPVIA